MATKKEIRESRYNGFFQAEYLRHMAIAAVISLFFFILNYSFVEFDEGWQIAWGVVMFLCAIVTIIMFFIALVMLFKWGD